MGELVTLDVPEHLARSARQVAHQTQRSLEAVLLDWLERASTDLPVEALLDQEVLALRDLELAPEQQSVLSSLLADQREGVLGPSQRAELDRLLESYRRHQVLKARALKVAVERGLQPPLSEPPHQA